MTTLRIATFNLENLFTRPAAMEVADKQAGQDALDAHAELNALIAKDTYTARDFNCGT